MSVRSISLNILGSRLIMKRLSKHQSKLKITLISMTIVVTKIMYLVLRSVRKAALIRRASKLTSKRTALVKRSANLTSILSSPKFQMKAVKNAITNTQSSTSNSTATCRSQI